MVSTLDEIAAYTKIVNGGYTLTGWHGDVKLIKRCKVVKTYRANEFGDTGEAIVFKLKGRKFIVGYTLGNGMLFRGELIECSDMEEAEEAEDYAKELANYWLQVDAEDAEEFQAMCEQEAEQEAIESIGSIESWESI